MQRRIFRTEGNAYEKLDQDRFMIRPRFQDVQHTSFLAARDLILSKPDEDNCPRDVDNIETASILAEIKQMKL